jgi:hypothetical protein
MSVGAKSEYHIHTWNAFDTLIQSHSHPYLHPHTYIHIPTFEIVRRQIDRLSAFFSSLKTQLEMYTGTFFVTSDKTFLSVLLLEQ